MFLEPGERLKEADLDRPTPGPSRALPTDVLPTEGDVFRRVQNTRYLILRGSGRKRDEVSIEIRAVAKIECLFLNETSGPTGGHDDSRRREVSTDAKVYVLGGTRSATRG